MTTRHIAMRAGSAIRLGCIGMSVVCGAVDGVNAALPDQRKTHHPGMSQPRGIPQLICTGRSDRRAI
jgi:hypothetical protein